MPRTSATIEAPYKWEIEYQFYCWAVKYTLVFNKAGYIGIPNGVQNSRLGNVLCTSRCSGLTEFSDVRTADFAEMHPEMLQLRLE
jgi:hypothetical protein